MPSRSPELDSLLPQLPEDILPFVQNLLTARLIDEEPLRHFLQERQDVLLDYSTPARLTQGLVRYNLLTAHQRESVLAGTGRQLLLGNYRILDVLGTGGMGTVYRGEHCLLKRKVALKVVPLDDDLHPTVRQRFYAEMRSLAELTHPHIVTAFDAGEVPGNARTAGSIYLVLELVTGGDLEQYVQQNGPCSVGQACDFIRQAASGLNAAHDRHIIHRDLKPSNLLLTEDGQVKLVDFGLARHFVSRITDPRTLLGSLDFMPPEQSVDPSSIGKEADIYGLGATLFYLLTGEPPYPHEENLRTALVRLQKKPPRRLLDLRDDIPQALDDLVARMLHRDPAARPVPPLLVAHALAPFVFPTKDTPLAISAETSLPLEAADPERPRHLLLLADPGSSALGQVLTRAGFEVHETDSFEAAVAEIRRESVPLVVIHREGAAGELADLCGHLRARSAVPMLKLVVVTDEPAVAHADDLVPQRSAKRLLPARIDLLLKWKETEERAQLLTAQLEVTAHQLRETLQARTRDVREAHNALLFAMAKMAESREGETPGHLKRLQRYTRALAIAAAALPPWTVLIDSRFLEVLERCLPLHDIGKIGLPEDILLKPAALNAQERALVETHPLIGDRILESLAREHGASLEFLGTARALVRHHHERYDGTGYPDKLVGEAIPAVARLTAVADVYDALRRARLHKRALSHDEAVRIILNRSSGQFDPVLVQAFSACHPRFEEIYQELSD
jgi:response regulator RpfG family c-di-GMP phosphodiesterase/tRNA A-37 threonylcarbamoyl transferase component Bud32